jgi:hypothetical protein
MVEGGDVTRPAICCANARLRAVSFGPQAQRVHDARQFHVAGAAGGAGLAAYAQPERLTVQGQVRLAELQRADDLLRRQVHGRGQRAARGALGALVTGRQRLTAGALNKVNRLTPGGLAIFCENAVLAVGGREVEGKWHAVLLDSIGDGWAWTGLHCAAIRRIAAPLAEEGTHLVRRPSPHPRGKQTSSFYHHVGLRPMTYVRQGET